MIGEFAAHRDGGEGAGEGMQRGDGETGEGHEQQEHPRCQLGEVKLEAFLTIKKRDSFKFFKRNFFGGLGEIVIPRVNFNSGRMTPSYQLTIEDYDYIFEMNARDFIFYQHAQKRLEFNMSPATSLGVFP